MEQLKEAFYIAIANLAANVVRSLLSILGVVIGIAAVIVVLSIGAGARQRILDQINSMGVNVYTVMARYDEETQRIGELQLEDIGRIQELPSVMTALPKMTLYKSVRSRSAENRAVIIGVDPSYLQAKRQVVLKGRNFSPIEAEERALVCMINENADRTFFGGGDESADRALFIEGLPWNVIGVFGPPKDNKRKPAVADGVDLEIWMPMNTLLRNMKDLSIDNIEIQVKPDAGPSVKEDILAAMERNDPRRKGLFHLREQKEYYERSMEVQKSLSMIGALVAGISLIVGGIGMMNVMLTSVAERTREIGVRRAVGARKKDILYQFLVESCVLSGAGSVLGLILGAALARGLPFLFQEFFTVAPVIRPVFVLFAVVAGAALGIAFGFYPAIKASRFSPAEALRTE